jgi:hypothetical protein
MQHGSDHLSTGGEDPSAAAASAGSRRKNAAPRHGKGVAKQRSGPKPKTSPFIGVSRYKRTGRFEAHIWFVGVRWWTRES